MLKRQYQEKIKRFIFVFTLCSINFHHLKKKYNFLKNFLFAVCKRRKNKIAKTRPQINQQKNED